ncbi:MAG: peptide chain release factor N(5)-glutamine methyltransferase [Acidobacteria bacterium]|nr:peptide chain release factor N(5)-glutamine methyltransferase [Acidobacteriota bacterium]MCW5948534.1 peptide chain release factor N(5)-glutamine methyltransferase [Pyrinomonadaceae bacterium]
MTIGEALAAGAARLQAAGIREARRDADLLLRHVTGATRAWVIAHPEAEMASEQAKIFADLISRREEHEPVQYITGVQEFFGREFEVSPAVLIPRPETEIAVEAAVEHLSALGNPKFVELGIGSGCISISILAEVASARGIGVDLSPQALPVAERNAAKHNVAARLDLRRSDLFSAVDETGLDAVVSNPPYVPDDVIATLEPEVNEYEPRLALAGGSEGLDVVRRIIAGSPGRLRPGGLLVIEIGIGQSFDVENMFDPESWTEAAVIPDLQGIPRTLRAIFRGR